MGGVPGGVVQEKKSQKFEFLNFSKLITNVISAFFLAKV
jgi:hypothetical protein